MCAEPNGRKDVISCNGFWLEFDEGERLTRIGFRGQQAFSLGDFVDRFGEPDEIYFERGSIPEAATMLITVAFIDDGVWVGFEHPTVDYTVTAEMASRSVEYLPAG